MSIRYAIFIIGLVFTSQITAADFPTGRLKGIGFVVEKGSMKITDKDLHAYSSSATIVKRSDSSYEFTIVAQLQELPSTPQKTDKRVDIFTVVWESPNSGRLINTDLAYKSDKTSFTISDNELVLKSWIARNQHWETHIYALAE